MKKIISIFLLLSFANFSSALAFNNALIDEFAQKTLDKNLKIKIEKQETIEDTFAIKTLNPNLQIKKAQYIPIVDEFAIKTLDKNIPFEKISPRAIDDKLVQKAKISPIQKRSTRNLSEGENINFRLLEDILVDGKHYKSGSIIKGRIETVAPNQAMGTPASLIVGNFALADNVKLDGQISQTGANRTIWLYPTVLTMNIFCGLGILFMPIRGGHAKLRPSKIYEIDIRN